MPSTPGPVNPGNYLLTTMNASSSSFLINGIPSGPNLAVDRPGAPAGTVVFGPPVSPSMLEFQAYFEGELHNSLYPPSNPIVYLSDVQGYINLNLQEIWLCTDEPMIVPGAPGMPPITAYGQLDAGARATYIAASGTLTFGENTDLSLFPDVTVVRQADGTYVSQAGLSEPAVGASVQLSPLQYIGTGPDGRYLFNDGAITIYPGAGHSTADTSGRLPPCPVTPRQKPLTGTCNSHAGMGALLRIGAVFRPPVEWLQTAGLGIGSCSMAETLRGCSAWAFKNRTIVDCVTLSPEFGRGFQVCASFFRCF